MSLLRPVVSGSHSQGKISQGFDGQFSWERSGYLHAGTPARYGRRTALAGATAYAHLHLATDYISALGTKLYAVHAGKVIAQFTDVDGAVVLYLRVLRTDKYDLVYAYWHCERGSFQQPTGTHVSRGDFIVRSGNTGQVTGAHLHGELWRAPVGTPVSKLYSVSMRFDDAPFIAGAPLAAIT